MNIEQIISKMTLEQKARMLAGASGWTTVGYEELGIPSIWVSDGPHGVRKKRRADDGGKETIPVVCFPPACATACSFDTELIGKMAETVAEECHALDVDVLLGPGVNIKRSPLCGRNFEYFSEDPVVAAKMGGAFIEACQSRGIGTSLKHYAMNNQEHQRFFNSSEVDERTMREIYLYAFEQIVKKHQPWTVMAAYNKVNGVPATENKDLLTDKLRTEWGFEGYVMSDWGAVNHRVLGVKAGLDMEMPYQDELNEQRICAAVRAGELDEADVDARVRCILGVVKKAVEGRRGAEVDFDVDHKIAKEIADGCVVLLKNDDKLLPFAEGDKVAFIGEFAVKPRYQGGGSSHVNSLKVTSAVDYAADKNVSYAQGYEIDSEESNEALVSEAVALAKACDKVAIFAGLPERFESEGLDRKHLHIPENQVALIEAVAAVNPNVAIVLQNGSAVEMVWLDKVKSVLECYLGGQAISETVVDTLYGLNNPSGRLTETLPYRIEDTPAFTDFGGMRAKTVYNEGIFVGYRYYDKRNIDVIFPFGAGMSYTTFAYSDLKLSADSIKDTETLTVSVTVTNTGDVFGKEVVQLYVADKTGVAIRPVRELKEFAKVALNPGESKTVSFTLDKRAFAWYSVELGDFYAATGEYSIDICANSREVILSAPVYVEATTYLPLELKDTTTLGELCADPRTAAFGEELVGIHIDVRYGREATEAERVRAYNAPLVVHKRYRKMSHADFEALLEKIRGMLV